MISYLFCNGPFSVCAPTVKKRYAFKFNGFGKNRRTISSGGMYESVRKRKSPYLKQHAENPVEWFPWGKEAYAERTGRLSLRTSGGWI